MQKYKAGREWKNRKAGEIEKDECGKKMRDGCTGRN